MRESLAAALALACQNQANALLTERNQRDTDNPMDSRDSHFSSSSEGGQVPVSRSAEVFPSNELTTLNKTSGSKVLQYSLPDEDVPFCENFFAKDDLLQGNEISWAFNFDMHMEEGKESQHTEKSLKEDALGHKEGVETLTPEDLAFKIEAELFKLFGDVNKKYREKGRSLLFNLKDRNNLELRERVMSGKISPERLCSMSAEELASKELTEWRMAKAEELAQMKVLPDTEVDIKRLVRKTHKGEFQVEVEHDDLIAAEVSAGSSFLTRPHRKKAVEFQSPSGASDKDKEKVAGQASSSEGQDFSGSLIFQTDETDPMQGMMVDELKDADLPPIVSLDEFMESLNTEPPFEDLSGDAGKKSPVPYDPSRESPKRSSNLRASNQASDVHKDASAKEASFVKKPDMMKDLSVSPVKETVCPSYVRNADLVWNGLLQLNTSSSVTVGGLFYSGEKTSTKECPASLEIKGRVRLDAFEKFIQELPMSRTRAVMVLHFILRDKSSEEQRSNLSQAVKKHSLKKQPFGAPTNTLTRKPQQPPLGQDEDNDIPPGFGPGVAAKDGHDLPEFNFSSSHFTSRKGLQDRLRMGELIKRYGQEI
ncbi:PHD finger protein 3-like [Salvia splendens]|uniref:PHD finger protein 3-like n=1 Tax=Salvia splendens TaxID=180675 RepID=UPI001C276A15|nr:PHD finger protein 3-like [Salvia splendens]XP_042039011.1 PHD finger protein 3-like [Salvia splendens]